MSRYVFTTTGTQPFLMNYLQKYPEHQLTLMRHLDGQDSFLLMEESNEPSVFRFPFCYLNDFQYGQKKNDNIAAFQHIGLTPENEKSFLLQFENVKNTLDDYEALNALYLLRLEKKLLYIILTFWEQKTDFKNWMHTNELQWLTYYTKDHQSQTSEITYTDFFLVKKRLGEV